MLLQEFTAQDIRPCHSDRFYIHARGLLCHLITRSISPIFRYAARMRLMSSIV